jgi:hypothetical protein
MEEKPAPFMSNPDRIGVIGKHFSREPKEVSPLFRSIGPREADCAFRQSGPLWRDLSGHRVPDRAEGKNKVNGAGTV